MRIKMYIRLLVGLLGVIAIGFLCVVLIKKFGVPNVYTTLKPQKFVVDQGIAQSQNSPMWSLGMRLAGFYEERIYLVLLQNNHELRPTGGFIGQFAIVKIHKGRIKEVLFEDTGVFDSNAPIGVQVPRAPAPLVTYLGQNFMFLRDANWNPIFSESARLITKIYSLEGGKYADRIDGVIAIDTQVLSEVMDYVGSISINGIVYEKETLIDTLEYQVEVAYKEKGIHKDERKNVLTQLGHEIISRAKKLSPVVYVSILERVSQLLAEKHILLFDVDSAIQQEYELNGWSGEKKYADGAHVIRVVDANLNAFKTDRVIERSLQHSGTMKDGYATYELTLNYNHTQPVSDYRTREYRSYTRVYLPDNTLNVAIEGGGAINKADGEGGYDEWIEHHQRVIGFFFSVGMGTSRSITMSYTSPIIPSVYVFIKQPGTLVPLLTTSYKFDTYTEDCTYEGDVRIDRQIDCREALP